MRVDARTKVGITIGDPAGIGPEIVAAALSTAPREWRDRLVVYGDRGPLERAAKVMNVALPDVELVGGVSAGSTNLPASTEPDGERATPGRPDHHSGAAQVGYLEAAVHCAM